MRKPPTGSPDSLKTKDLLEIMKVKKQWTSEGIFATILPKYPAYDKDGLNHKMRQTLYSLVKQGKIERVDRGIYLTKF